MAFYKLYDHSQYGHAKKGKVPLVQNCPLCLIEGYCNKDSSQFIFSSAEDGLSGVLVKPLPVSTTSRSLPCSQLYKLCLFDNSLCLDFCLLGLLFGLWTLDCVCTVFTWILRLYLSLHCYTNAVVKYTQNFIYQYICGVYDDE